MSPFRSARSTSALALLVLVVVAGAALIAPPAARAASPSVTFAPVTGNLSGPAYLSVRTNGTYSLNATGGPAVLDGTIVGGLNWTAQITGPDLAGVNITPKNGSIKSLANPASINVSVGTLAETLTLEVEVVSGLGKSSASINLTYSITVRVPYVVYALLVAGANNVLAFTLLVYLDGSRVGNVSVPLLKAHQSYNVIFRYARPGLSAGWHTFLLSVVDEHGLVAFADGAPSFSTSFYVPAPAPNNSIWYVAGAVAFFGALFIFATRVAARRRGAGRR